MSIQPVTWHFGRALQGYLWRARGIECDITQIIVVSGSQQALDCVRGVCRSGRPGCPRGALLRDGPQRDACNRSNACRHPLRQAWNGHLSLPVPKDVALGICNTQPSVPLGGVLRSRTSQSPESNGRSPRQHPTSSRTTTTGRIDMTYVRSAAVDDRVKVGSSMSGTVSKTLSQRSAWLHGAAWHACGALCPMQADHRSTQLELRARGSRFDDRNGRI